MSKFRQIIALAAALLITSSPIASAHTSIVSTTPEYKSTLSEMPSTIEIEFTEALMTIGDKNVNSIEITGPDGAAVALSETHVEENILIATISPQDFLDGTYLISYRVVSADGHGVSGSYEIYLNAPTVVTQSPIEVVDHKSFFHLHQAHFLWSGIALIVIFLWIIYRRFERNQS